MKPADSPALAANRALLAKRLRRLAQLAFLALAGIYLFLVVAGFIWLRYLRKVDEVRFLDVALLNAGAVHRSIAVEQFARAKRDWDSKSYQAAYVAYASALRHDPNNIPGRLSAAEFFLGVGSPVLAQNVLEDGLTLAPQDPRLIESTFDLFLAAKRDRAALTLLHTLYPSGLAGPNAATLQMYEVLATLTADGPQPARQLLDRYPDLLSHPAATPIIARVYWESAERPKAISMLAEHVEGDEATLAEFERLAAWQQAEDRKDDAVKTAELACSRFPTGLPARILLLSTQAARSPDGRPAPASLDEFLRDYGDRPETLHQLATLAGSRGWVDVARILYQFGAVTHGNLPHLALAYSDALMTRSRFREAVPLLADIEAQAGDDDVALAVQLRQRQVVGAAAVGDSIGVREHARRLGAAIGNNPDAMDLCRRFFLKLGIADAVDELTPRAAKPVKVADNK
ncbi:MAG TPA: hypothetical protein VMM36_02410 [Opitutaceae bacterium]|nr:hypothetical protein [Opitutaceae bacterium]